MNIIYVFAFLSLYQVVSLPLKKTNFQKKRPAFDGKNLVGMFKKSPKAMVSVVSQLDPNAVYEIVTMLQKLLDESEEEERKLSDRVTDSEVRLGQATDTHNAIQLALDEIKAQVETVEGHLVATEENMMKAKENLDSAQGEYDDQLPLLDAEQETLREVIALLAPYHDESHDPGSDDDHQDDHHGYNWCSSHQDCSDMEFCTAVGSCAACEHCHWNSYSVDQQCPDKCPVLCEDEPPQYPKCPLCSSQEDCDLLPEIEDPEENKDWPHCDDDSGRCEITEECKQAVWDYQQVLEQWFMSVFTPEMTEMPPLQDWPASGHSYCECISVQATCVLEAQCYADMKEDEEDDMPFTMHEFCDQGMKCEADHCDWANAFNPEFLMKKMSPISMQKFHH